MIKLILPLFFLPTICFAQTFPEYEDLKIKSDYLVNEDSAYVKFLGTTKYEQTENLIKECESFYGKIQFFIKASKYEDWRGQSENTKALRQLRNRVCKKHVELLERQGRFEEVKYWKWRYVNFLNE